MLTFIALCSMMLSTPTSEYHYAIDSYVMKPGDTFFDVSVKDSPKPDESFLLVANGSNDVVEILWNGKVRYDTNNVDQATRDFWEVFTKSFPELRKRVALEYMKEMLEREEKK